MPRISILMPVFNGSKYLRHSIGSIVSQTFGDWQLVVLDDGSIDGSHEILQELAKADGRISMMSKENDGKGYVAANLAVMYPHATGEFFFYMSQDDELSTDCLEQLISRADETGAEVVIPEMILRHEDGSEGTWPCSFPPGGNYDAVISGKDAFYLATDFSINGFALVSARLMKDECNDVQWFNSDEYNTRLQYLRAESVAFSHGTFYYHVGNPNAVTTKFSVKRFESLRTVLMLEKAFNETFTDKRQRLKMKRELFGTYVAMLILYANNIANISTQDEEQIFRHVTFYEQNVSFKGFRRMLFGRLQFHEKIFAVCIFNLNSRRLAVWIYRLWHGIKQTIRRQ